MLQVSKKLQKRMLEKRQDEWLQEQIAIARSAHPQACEGLDDSALGERLEKLFNIAQENDITLNANHQRFAHVALALNDDNYIMSQEWAATIFAWKSDENMKISACEQYIAAHEDNGQGGIFT